MQNRENEQIEKLMTSAGIAGDLAQVAICQIALTGEIDDRTQEALSENDWKLLTEGYLGQGLTRGAKVAQARAECMRVIAEHQE